MTPFFLSTLKNEIWHFYSILTLTNSDLNYTLLAPIRVRNLVGIKATVDIIHQSHGLFGSHQGQTSFFTSCCSPVLSTSANSQLVL